MSIQTDYNRIQAINTLNQLNQNSQSLLVNTTQGEILQLDNRVFPIKDRYIIW
jgi:hypothetical protein